MTTLGTGNRTSQNAAGFTQIEVSAAVISSEHAHAIGFYPNGTYDGAVAVVWSRDEPDVTQMPVDSVTARVALSDSQL